jgi:hypothetical protein
VARLFLRKALKQSGLRGKKMFFNRWKNDIEFDKADEGVDMQHMLVEEVQETVEYAGSLQNRKLAVKTSLSNKRKQQ